MNPVRWLLPVLLLGTALFLAACPGKDGMMNNDDGMMDSDSMSQRSAVGMWADAA